MLAYSFIHICHWFEEVLEIGCVLALGIPKGDAFIAPRRKNNANSFVLAMI